MTSQPLSTPLLFLMFDRPEETRRAFSRVRDARPLRLYLAADGPRDRSGDPERCQAARDAVLGMIDWDCELQVLFRQENLGCKRAVSSAISWFFEQVEEGIVVEDDCVAEPTFFGFCEDLLRRYRDDPRVFHVGGDNFQIGVRRGDASYYASRYPHVWGWATWRRAWERYDVEMAAWPEARQSGMLARTFACSAEAAYWTRIFDEVHAGRIDTWDYQWLFAVWRQSGISLTPNVNLVSNVGFSASATHKTTAAPWFARLPTAPTEEQPRHPPTLQPDEEADAFTFRYVFEGRMNDVGAVASDIAQLVHAGARRQAVERIDQALAVHPSLSELKSIRAALVQPSGSEGLPATAAGGARPQQVLAGEPEIVASAIVSTYASERFMRGCLDDLMGQTLFARGQLEILIIDSGSPQNERAIVESVAGGTPQVRYLRTERETMYGAWNRGLRMARGRYLTNANTDDRHRPDAIEVLARLLDGRPDIDAAYGDCYVSAVENQTFEQNDHTSLYRFPVFFPPAALLYYQLGPQALWRRSLHPRIGEFAAELRVVGDYDFNLRLARSAQARLVPAALGLFLDHPGSLSNGSDNLKRETVDILRRYRQPQDVEAYYRNAGVPVDSDEDRAWVHLDMGVRALEYYPPWLFGKPEGDPAFAMQCFLRAAELRPSWAAPFNNFAVALARTGQDREALALLDRKLARSGDPRVQANRALLGRGGPRAELALAPSRLRLPSQRDLALERREPIPAGTWPAATTPVLAELGAAPPLKVTLVGSTPRVRPGAPNGGAETALIAAADALARRGHDVTLAANLPGVSRSAAGVRYVPFGDWQRELTVDRGSVPDVLAFASGPDVGCHRLAGPHTARVMLFHHQELKFLQSPDPRATVEATTDAVVCVSHAVKENLVAGGLVPERVFVVPNGLDSAVFHPRAVERRARRLVFAGALVADKNPLLLLEAFVLASARLPGLELEIYGDASLWDEPDRLNLPAVKALLPQVSFRGAVSHEELAVAYSRATLCVIPSRYESFSLVSVEAQACGCVPLAAVCGGLPETMVPGVTGFLYAPNSPAALADALVGLFEHPARLEEASRFAIEFAPRAFSWDRTAAQMEAIFRDLLRVKRSNAGESPAPARSVLGSLV